jgi:uridine kinase
MRILLKKTSIVFLLLSFLLKTIVFCEEKRSIDRLSIGTLHPVSAFFYEASRIDMQATSIGLQIIKKIIDHNLVNAIDPIISVNDLYTKLIRHLIPDLNKYGISVFFYDKRIELVRQNFTLVFADNDHPLAKARIKIPNTKITVNILSREKETIESEIFEQLQVSIKNADNLQDSIESGRMRVLITQWASFSNLITHPTYRIFNHMPPQEHVLLTFQKLETPQFNDLFKKYKITQDEITYLKTALLFHDLGLTISVDRSANLEKNEYLKHPLYSVEIAQAFMKRAGNPFTDYEEQLILTLIKYHSILADFARYGESSIASYDEFLQDIRRFGKKGLALLYILQLADASSVRHKVENSISLGLEKRLSEITDIIEDIIEQKEDKEYAKQEKFMACMKDIKRQNHEVTEAFNLLKASLRRNNILIEDNLLIMAYRTMNNSHLGILRKDDKTPYAIHCIETARILIEELGIIDVPCIIAALLHDIREDTRTTSNALEEMFGPEIRQIVDILSKPSKELYTDKEERDRDYFRHIIYGTGKTKSRKTLTKAQIVKIADRISNLRTLETKDPGFPKKTILNTYESFIPYFVGKTEVPVAAKRKLINELIEANNHWKILSEFQIKHLQILHKNIVDFKIPRGESEQDPFSFINNRLNWWLERFPGSTPVLAFDGMSGSGRTEFTETLKSRLEKTGKHVVVFDSTDFLISRIERDIILEAARQSGEKYQEQREKLFRFDEFEEKVLKRIQSFKESNNPSFSLSLSGLYERDSPEVSNLQAVKDYPFIGRNTVIIIEGMHALQERFQKYYDMTFFLHADQDKCIGNLHRREIRKVPSIRQPAQKIENRFKYLDWPSYSRHFMEYWYNSDFIIDNNDYFKPRIQANPFTQHNNPAAIIPHYLTNPHSFLSKKLSKLSKTLKNSGINLFDIFSSTRNYAKIFLTLLSVDEAGEILKNISNKDTRVPTLDSTSDDLAVFYQYLEATLSESQLKNYFFRLIIAYLLEQKGSLQIVPCTTTRNISSRTDKYYFRRLLAKKLSRPAKKHKFSLSNNAYEFPINIEDLTDPKQSKILRAKLKKIIISLEGSQSIIIKIQHTDRNPQEIKTIFSPFYDSLNFKSRKAKKRKITLLFPGDKYSMWLPLPPNTRQTTLEATIKAVLDTILRLNSELDDIIALEAPERHNILRQKVLTKLKKLSHKKSTNPISNILAWHLLHNISQNKDTRAVLIYSLTEVLESGIDPDLLKRLLACKKGKIYFYAGDRCTLTDRYNYLKHEGYIISTDDIQALSKKHAFTVYMLNNYDAQDLQLDDLEPGKLKDGKVLLPLSSKNKFEEDLLLGNEIIRVNGHIEELPSLFKRLLRKMLAEYFTTQGKQFKDFDLDNIVDNEPTAEQIEDAYKEIHDIIISA